MKWTGTQHDGVPKRLLVSLFQWVLRAPRGNGTPTHLGFEEFDVANQIAFSHHYWVADGQLETFSAPFRYVWPSELDLMARLAGMTLRERWSNWNREPFTSDSREHISVWHKAR